MKKVCTVCKIEKSLADFPDNKRVKSGKSSFCRPCTKKKHILYKENYKKTHNIQEMEARRHSKKRAALSQVQIKDAKLRARYKITIDQYNILSEIQGGVCAICKKPETMRFSKKSPLTRPLGVDHCHTTSKVRGLLCSRCNSGIGHLHDNIDLLQSAIEYLKRTQ